MVEEWTQACKSAKVLVSRHCPQAGTLHLWWVASYNEFLEVRRPCMILCRVAN